tara:strand:+ start:1122 stop:1427 length:306 start_codon:yes stop_codon:yes gene_type:complete
MAPSIRINQPPSDIVIHGHHIHAPPAGVQPANISTHEVSTAFSVWAGSSALARYLGLHGDRLQQPTSILELGAGTGLAASRRRRRCGDQRRSQTSAQFCRS